MMKALARVGDVHATVSTAKNYPNDAAPTATGNWAVSPSGVTEKPVPSAACGGSAVVVSATCAFVFTGTNSASGAPFTSPLSIVSLASQQHILRVGSSYPLVDGDENHDEYGNSLKVDSTATWRCA
jgi:hypothetical protein